MPLQLDLKQQELLSLKDAIAYEFFMENVKDILQSCKDKDEDFTKGVAMLAKSSYVLAQIFCAARELHVNPSTES